MNSILGLNLSVNKKIDERLNSVLKTQTLVFEIFRKLFKSRIQLNVKIKFSLFENVMNLIPALLKLRNKQNMFRFN